MRTHCSQGHALTGNNAMPRSNRPTFECRKCSNTRRTEKRGYDITKPKRPVARVRIEQAIAFDPAATPELVAARLGCTVDAVWKAIDNIDAMHAEVA